MKEDILEQMVDDWLLSSNATFTKHNVKFKPIATDVDFDSHSDAVPSDIDILAVHLNAKGYKRVRAVGCKSYQGGFNPEHWWNLLTHDKDKKVSGRQAWKHHRELCSPKWGKAFARKVMEETLSSNFVYTIAVAKLTGDNIAVWKQKFINEKRFINNLKLTPRSKVTIEIVTVEEMVKHYLNNRNSTTVEPSQFGRLMQVLRASGADIKYP